MGYGLFHSPSQPLHDLIYFNELIKNYLLKPKVNKNNKTMRPNLKTEILSISMSYKTNSLSKPKVNKNKTMMRPNLKPEDRRQKTEILSILVTKIQSSGFCPLATDYLHTSPTTPTTPIFFIHRLIEKTK